MVEHRSFGEDSLAWLGAVRQQFPALAGDVDRLRQAFKEESTIMSKVGRRRQLDSGRRMGGSARTGHTSEESTQESEPSAQAIHNCMCQVKLAYGRHSQGLSSDKRLGMGRSWIDYRQMNANLTAAAWCDTLMLLGLQGLLVVMPLALGGIDLTVQIAASIVAAALLGLWLCKASFAPEVLKTRGAGAPILALIAFSALVIFQTVPLPPWLLGTISPRAHALFPELLPGWPGTGGWAAWRPLAFEPFAGQVGLLAFSAPFAVFAILAGYPWGSGPADVEARRLVFGRLVATLLLSATLVAVVAVVQDEFRSHSPYASPNHLAGYLEMLIPMGAVYVGVLGTGLWGRFAHRTDGATRGASLLRRNRIATLVDLQQHLVGPLVGLAALALMLIAHRATDSRGGLISLGVAGMICAVGFLRRSAFGPEWLGKQRAVAAVLVAVALVPVLLGQWILDAVENPATSLSIEGHLRNRLLVILQAAPLLREFPLLGVGLGSWVHAFRLHQAPPIDTMPWNYAHNDYLQLAVETGVLGAVILLWFAWGVIRAARGSPKVLSTKKDNGRELVAAVEPTSGIGAYHLDWGYEWKAAFCNWELLRIGLVAGAGALMVHGLSDYNLRIPANALIFMTLLGLLVLSATEDTHGARRLLRAPIMIMAVIGFAAAGPALGLAPFTAGGSVSAWRQIEAADAPGIEQELAVAMARSAVELAPLAPETHEALGRGLQDPEAGDAAYGRAIRLSPDKARLRDLLALRLWKRGEQSAALLEFEESMAHLPRPARHEYLKLDHGLGQTAPRDHIEALAAGDFLPAQLRRLDPAIQQAIARGLERALDDGEYSDRSAIVADLATVLEAADRYAEAAAILEAWADKLLTDRGILKHAADDYLKAGDLMSAERVLTEQLARTPGDGELYQLLAVDVYAARRDFDAAELVLTAGRQNSAYMLPIYRGIRRVLTLQQ